MVKFSKQFEGQLVPEWKEAFVLDWQLKKDLKKIRLLNNNTTTNTHQTTSFPHNLLSSISTFGLFGRRRDRGVTQVLFGSLFSKFIYFLTFVMLELIDGGCGQVHKRLTASGSKGGDLLYETELLEQFADTDAAKEFFECLDMQLNKVNQFYKIKEKEFLERGECLKKQMQILSELKTIIKQQQRRKGEEEDASISCSISCEEDSVKDRTEQEQQQQDSFMDELERNEVPFSD
ncbi:hypothetical protein ES288_D03G139900v1 [Gossypium darwinii]|uniref:SPX domain-containing protein n=1 Tax=Gossypium darwinii TaxID=34276 RepID=A0A5D2D565_GOSDA|nr:hypothetical protein ES288_D03G139900v1 [Gossypium darwinii]